MLVLLAVGQFERARTRCGDDVTSHPAPESRSPFLDASQRREQPDRERDTLVAALAADPAPVGAVVGAVGYHYQQWAQVSAFAQGIGIRTRDNPDFTMLDDQTLRPRWSVEVETKRSTYDASADRYLVATMPVDKAPDLVYLDADDGTRAWCTTLDGGPVRPQDPFATQLLDGGDVAVVGPGDDARERLVRLTGQDGSLVWQRRIDAGSGDFVGDLGEDTLLVGGRSQSDLFDAEALAKRRAGPSLALVSAQDGRTLWTREAGDRGDLHVLGTDPVSGLAALTEWDPATSAARLKVLDRDGNQRWYAVPARGDDFDATLRAGRVLVRAGSQWSAYALTDGHRLWTRAFPDQPQFLPYGFALDSVPLLDDDHVLIGGTTALHTLDLDTGAITSAALPLDGVATTYWPYQLAVSYGLIAVATNTGAVVVRREAVPSTP